MKKINEFTFKENDPEFYFGLLYAEFHELVSDAIYHSYADANIERIKEIDKLFIEMNYSRHRDYLKTEIIKYIELKNKNEYELDMFDSYDVHIMGYILEALISQKELDDFVTKLNIDWDDFKRDG